MLLISKKDLLNETGISYGQLYRWKREGLIPEDWFIKKSSFTGQETFFPREKILKRIKAIQQLKDKYSLEELAKILSPEISERNFTVKDLQIIEEIENSLIPCFCNVFEKKSFSYMEVLIFIAISKCKKNFSLELKDVESICLGIKDHINKVKQADCIFALLDKNGEYFVSIYDERSRVFFDSRWIVLCQIQLNEISSLMKLKYRKSFNLRLDDEEKEDVFSFMSDRTVTT